MRLPSLITALAVVGILGAATTIDIVQHLRPDVSSVSGSVAVTLPNSQQAVWVQLGPNCSITNNVFNCTSSSSGPSPVPIPAVFPKPEAEIPSGVMDGKNTTFTIQNNPLMNSQILFWNGIGIYPGASDYTINGNTITFPSTRVPQAGDTLIIQYWH